MASTRGNLIEKTELTEEEDAFILHTLEAVYLRGQALGLRYVTEMADRISRKLSDKEDDRTRSFS